MSSHSPGPFQYTARLLPSSMKPLTKVSYFSSLFGQQEDILQLLVVLQFDLIVGEDAERHAVYRVHLEAVFDNCLYCFNIATKPPMILRYHDSQA